MYVMVPHKELHCSHPVRTHVVTCSQLFCISTYILNSVKKNELHKIAAKAISISMHTSPGKTMHTSQGKTMHTSQGKTMHTSQGKTMHTSQGTHDVVKTELTWTVIDQTTNTNTILQTTRSGQ